MNFKDNAILCDLQANYIVRSSRTYTIYSVSLTSREKNLDYMYTIYIYLLL